MTLLEKTRFCFHILLIPGEYFLARLFFWLVRLNGHIMLRMGHLLFQFALLVLAIDAASLRQQIQLKLNATYFFLITLSNDTFYLITSFVFFVFRHSLICLWIKKRCNLKQKKKVLLNSQLKWHCSYCIKRSKNLYFIWIKHKKKSYKRDTVLIGWYFSYKMLFQTFM